MKQDSLNINTEISRIEATLLSLWEGFEQYKLELTQSYRYAQTLLTRRKFGFSSREAVAQYEETLSHALQDYFRLRDQIDWWLGQARQVIDALNKMEQQASSTEAYVPEFNEKGTFAGGFGEESGMPFIDLGLAF